jgi:hypothetical protein
VFPLDVGVGVNLVGGLALLAVGTWLLILDHRRVAPRLLAGLLVSYGAAILLVTPRISDPTVALAARQAGFLGVVHATTAVLMLSIAFPRPFFRWAAAPAVVLVPPLVTLLLAFLSPLSAAVAPGQPRHGWLAAYESLISSVALLILVARLARESPGSLRRSLFLITLGAATLSAHFRSANLTRALVHGSAFGPANDAYFVVQVVSAVLIATSVVLAVRAATATDRQHARFLGVVLGMILVAATTGFLTGYFPSSAPILALSGVWRFGFAVLIAWGILRHHFLGVDRTIRWGISKGTIAGLFVAVFFAATEFAQEYFGSTGGSAYFGIGAAAILVFGLSPLHRAAERLASKAAPAETSETQTEDRAREDKYRAAVRLALRDRSLSREEERVLVGLAQELGVDAMRAYAIHDEVLRHVDSGVAARRRRPPNRG